MKTNFQFKKPAEYRLNSCAVLSTHDSALLANWWQFEAGTVDEKLFRNLYFSQSNEEKQYNLVLNTLFEPSGPVHGRLRWKENIIYAVEVVNAIKPAYGKERDFMFLYLESFGETKKFSEFVGKPDLSKEPSVDLVHRSFKSVNESSSIFSIQLLQEYLCLDDKFLSTIGKHNYRINTPGKFSARNWSLIVPLSIEKLNEASINTVIRRIVEDTNRL